MNADNQTEVGAVMVTSVLTGLFASIPESVISYAEKLGSVFLLAVVAELGRRLVTLLWKGKNQ